MVAFIRGWIRTFAHSPRAKVVALLFGALFLGLMIAGDYGISWDEIIERRYGWESLKAYKGISYSFNEFEIQKYYGPFFLIISNLGAVLLEKMLPMWSIFAASHFINYISFVIATLSIYSISRRYISSNVALLTAFLFFTQPLLFGHSFINQKDIPFMSFFVAAVAVGLIACDELCNRKNIEINDRNAISPVSRSYREWISADWIRFSKAEKIFLLAAVFFLIFLIIDLFFTRSVFLPLLETITTRAYHGKSWPIINRFFESVATQSGEIPLGAYLTKLNHQYPRIQAFLASISILAFLFLVLWRFRITTRNIQRNGLLQDFRVDLSGRGAISLLTCGVLIGMSTAIRPLGPLIILILGIVFITRLRKRALIPIGLITILSGLVTYFLWPFLWTSPLQNFWDSLTLASHHPWRGFVLYFGQIYRGLDLPWHYIPFLIIAQFTEVVLPLAGFGLYKGFRNKSEKIEMTALVAWFLIPLIGVTIVQATLFDNFRHFLFVIPPIFIFSGIGIEAIRNQIGSKFVKIIAGIAILLPGIIHLVILHPYQYSYYNAIVGGVEGAYRQFELDYWCTSYREAMEYANENLPNQAELAVWGPHLTARAYARDDLIISSIVENIKPEDTRRKYVLLCTRSNIDWYIQTEGSVEFQVNIQNVPLSILRYPD